MNIVNIDKILSEELLRLKDETIDRQVQAGQVASGKTRDSFEVVVDGYSGRLLGASYVGVLVKGRKPGGVPKDFIDILKRWAAVKNITFQNEKQFNQWAEAVKWKTIREGNKLYRSGQDKDIFDTPISNFMIRLTERTAVFYQEKIANEIFNF